MKNEKAFVRTVGLSEVAIWRISVKGGARLRPKKKTNLAVHWVTRVFDCNPLQELAFIGFRTPLIIGAPVNGR